MSAERELIIHRATGPVLVDGRMDEETWKVAEPVDLVFPWADQTGPRQKTTVRLLWDDKCLYAFYDCEDTDIVAHCQRRDDPVWQDDCVELFVNPDPSQTFYYGMEMNVRGALLDYFAAHYEVERHMIIRGIDFAGVQIATHVDGTLNMTGDVDRGWTLEMAVPFENFFELAKRKTAPDVGTLWTGNLNRLDGIEPHRNYSQWSPSDTSWPHFHNSRCFGRFRFEM